MTRAIAKLLVLFAVLLMPLGMTPAGAVTHHAAPASMAMGHCPDQGSSHDMNGGIAQCTMACAAALPAANLARSARMTIVCLPLQPTAAQRLHGVHPETATPPPKRS